MPITIGTDIIEIDRIRQALARRPALASRLFTEQERAYCDQRADAAPHYAARFAAKEAVAKAIGQSLAWRQVEILNDARGRPLVVLHQQAAALAQLAGGGSIQISLSHSRDYALATALLQLPESTPEDEPSDVPEAGG
jgi:holo-[acyl-carrier protein] synthase